MRHKYLVSVIFTALTTLSVNAVAQDSLTPNGSQALSQFKQNLQKTLLSSMNEGVDAAISACQIQAPEIAESLSQDGIRVGRASHRLRNPDNVSPDWVTPIMDAYLANPVDREPRSIALSEDRIGYVEPIIVQPLCTACHGEVIADDVFSKISELYPQDRATGYEVGDLRGVFWIETPSE